MVLKVHIESESCLINAKTYYLFFMNVHKEMGLINIRQSEFYKNWTPILSDESNAVIYIKDKEFYSLVLWRMHNPNDELNKERYMVHPKLETNAKSYINALFFI